jgi:hypothetical protein
VPPGIDSTSLTSNAVVDESRRSVHHAPRRQVRSTAGVSDLISGAPDVEAIRLADGSSWK